jgi:hypothetical protein
MIEARKGSAGHLKIDKSLAAGLKAESALGRLLITIKNFWRSTVALCALLTLLSISNGPLGDQRAIHKFTPGPQG